MTPDIHVNNLYYAYPPLTESAEAAPVLRGIHFEVARGESVVLLGRVGAGKTTLCMALDGLVPHATGGVFRGNVRVLGLDTKAQRIADLARHVGLVFQDPESQLVQMRVEDEVAFGLENLGVAPAEMEERVDWALAAVGLADYRDRSPLLLSGGEKQRLAIAAMLAMRPQVLVLDEPTASLDPAGKSAVFRVLSELRRKHEITIFMATQELERVPRFADRVMVLHDGKIALDGPPDDVFGQVPRLREMGVGAPQVVELAYLLSQRTKHRYHFTVHSQAFKELRQRAHKAKLRTAKAPIPPFPAARTDPLAERALIRVEDVSYQYEDGTIALHEVGLTVQSGDFLALLGPNGAGKTTLARHFNGLLRPSRGRVLVEYQDTRRTRMPELARLVGYVFQNPDHQIFAATVEEEIAFGLRTQELPPAIVAHRVAEALDRFRLAPYAHMPPALLGYGQRRQVALAAIIAMQPKVLILDEPTGGLDWRSRQELMGILVSLNTAGRTIVLITHDMRLAAEYAGRAVVLSAGRILFDGTPRALFAQQKILTEAQLAVPPVTRLARRLGREGIPPDVLTCAEFAAAWVARLGASKGGSKAAGGGSKAAGGGSKAAGGGSKAAGGGSKAAGGGRAGDERRPNGKYSAKGTNGAGPETGEAQVDKTRPRAGKRQKKGTGRP